MPLRHKDTKFHKDFLVFLCDFVTLWQDYEFLRKSYKLKNMHFTKQILNCSVAIILALFIYSCAGSHDNGKNKPATDTIDTTKHVKQAIPPPSQKQQNKFLVIKGSNVNLRVSPDLNAIRIKQLKTNDTCEIIEQGKKETINDALDYWYKVRFKHKEGWIFGAFTSLKLPAEQVKQEKH